MIRSPFKPAEGTDLHFREKGMDLFDQFLHNYPKKLNIKMDNAGAYIKIELGLTGCSNLPRTPTP